MLPFPSPLLMRAALPNSPQPPFGNVQFLSGFEGTDGATTFSNSEGVLTGLAITGHGSAQIDTAQFKFGSSSLLLNGTTDYVSLADNSNWTPSINGFVLESWIMFDPATDLSLSRVIMAQYLASGSNRSWVFAFGGTTTGLLFQGTNTGGAVSTIINYPWTPARGVWHYVAVERSAAASQTYRLYIAENGSSTASMVAKTTTGPLTFFNSPTDLTIGALSTSSPSTFFQGWIDETRYINGFTPYDTDSGFTAPSSAFPRS
jgi:hypothetical protein